MRKALPQTGISLLELIIVLGILLLIVAVSIPSVIVAGKNANRINFKVHFGIDVPWPGEVTDAQHKILEPVVDEVLKDLTDKLTKCKESFNNHIKEIYDKRLAIESFRPTTSAQAQAALDNLKNIEIELNTALNYSTCVESYQNLSLAQESAKAYKFVH